MRLCADLAAKGTYYLNCKTGQASISAIAFKGSEQKTRKDSVRVLVILVLARGLNLLVIRMLNVSCLYIPQTYIAIALKSSHSQMSIS